MAITTIPGASSTDKTSLIGTTGADTISSDAASLRVLSGRDGADTLKATESATDYEVYGGKGNDSERGGRRSPTAQTRRPLTERR